MKIYMIQEGCPPCSVCAEFGAFTAKEDAEARLNEMAEDENNFFIENCSPRIIEVILHDSIVKNTSERV